MKADAVLLDVDGTLWNTTPIVAVAWNKVLEEKGLDRRVDAAELRTLFGKPMDEIAAAVLAGTDPSHWEEISAACLQREEVAIEENQEDISFPGVVDTIKTLSKRIPVCIVSNCQAGYIELAMNKLCIREYIADYESFGATGKGKADNIRLVCERNGYKEAVYVGDILRDEIASKEAGVRFIHAAYGFGKAKTPDAVIDNFSELSELIEN